MIEVTSVRVKWCKPWIFFFSSWPPVLSCTCDQSAVLCWPRRPLLSSLWSQLLQSVPCRPLLFRGTLTLLPSSLELELPPLELLALELVLEASSDPSSLAMLAIHLWNSSSSPMPFWVSPCLRPWDCFVSWWPSSFCSLSKRIRVHLSHTSFPLCPSEKC